MSANGRLLPSELTKVQDGALPITLAKVCAQQWFKLKTAYDAAHTDKLSIAAPIGGYRSYLIQEDMHLRPWLYGLSTYSTIKIAPAGYSTHGDGMCVDVADASTDTPRKRWLLANASKFGFIRQFGDRDPNHYRLESVPADTGYAPIPTTRKKDNMPAVIKRTENGDEWSLIWPALAGPSPLERGYVLTTDPERAKWWERFYELGQGTADKFGRDEYVAAQGFARQDHAAWLAGQPVGVAGVVADLGPVEAAVKTVGGQVAALDSKVSALPKPPTTFTAQ